MKATGLEIYSTTPELPELSAQTANRVVLRVESLVDPLQTAEQREAFGNVFLAVYRAGFYKAGHQDSQAQILQALEKNGRFRTILYGTKQFNTDQHKHHIEVIVNPQAALVEVENWIDIECDPITVTQLAEKLFNREPLSIPEKVQDVIEKVEEIKLPELDLNQQYTINMEVTFHNAINTLEEQQQAQNNFMQAYESGRLKRYGNDDYSTILQLFKTTHGYSLTVFDGDIKYSVNLRVDAPEQEQSNLQTTTIQNDNATIQGFAHFLAKITRIPISSEPIVDTVNLQSTPKKSEEHITAKKSGNKNLKTPANKVNPTRLKAIGSEMQIKYIWLLERVRLKAQPYDEQPSKKEMAILRKLHGKLKSLYTLYPLDNITNEKKLTDNRDKLISNALTAIKQADEKGNDQHQTLRTVLKSLVVGLMCALILPGIIYLSYGAYQNSQVKKGNKTNPFLYFQSPKRPNQIHDFCDELGDKFKAIKVAL